MRARLIRSLEAGLAGALVAGVWEAARSGVWAPSLAVWLLLAPIIAGVVLFADLALHATPEEPPARSATLVLASVGAALTAVLLGAVLGRLAGVFNNLDLLGPATVIVATAVVFGAAAVAFLLRAPVTAAWSKLPPRVGLVLAGVIGFGAVFLAIRGPALTLGKGASPWPFVFLGAAIASGLLWAVVRRNAHRWWPAAAVLLACVALIATKLDRVGDPELRLTFERAQGGVPHVVAILQRLADGDGDGHSDVLGGGDCDDTDPTIHPAAADLPGNDLDEDCSGADAEKPKAKPPKRVRYIRRSKALRKRWNLLFITIDALRADHLELYGYHRETAPNLAKLGDRSLVFDRAYAPANATRHAVPALLAGRPLARMDIDLAGTRLVIRPGNELLFERLRGMGYNTVAHLSSYLAENIWFGLDAGFENFVAHRDVGIRDPHTGPGLTDAVIGTIDGVRQGLDPRPWAVWVHYLEPHEPYVVQPDSPFPAETDIDRYDGEIHAVDAELGRLLQALEDRGLERNTLVAIASDHGEEFGEHGKKFHGRQLFDESIRIPLIIHVPGADAVRVQSPVSAFDLVETLGNLVGARPGIDHGARTHVARLMKRGKDDWKRRVFIDSIHHDDRPKQRQMAVVEWPFKYIVDFRNGAQRLFQLEQDPGERTNLAKKHPKRLGRFAELTRERAAEEQQAQVAHMLATRVSQKIPRGKRPRPAADGVEWLGAKGRRLDKDTFELTMWWRATEARRPDYRVRVEWYDASKRKRGRRDARPLAGRYPTHRWATGDVVRDVVVVHTRGARPPLRARVSLLRGKDSVWGPIDAARVE